MNQTYSYGRHQRRRVPQILYAENRPLPIKTISGFLTESGYKVETTGSVEDALAKIKQMRYELVLIDNELKAVGGMKLVTALRDCKYCGKIIVMTEEFEVEKMEEYRQLAVDRTLNKPIDLSDLLNAVRFLVASTTHGSIRA